MNIPLASASVYTDLNSLDQLKYKLKGNSVGDLRVVSQQFEALFIQQMLKTMREAKLSDGAFDSNESDLYVEMLDKQWSLNLSQGKGIGLADIIVDQLSHTLNVQQAQAALPSAPTLNSTNHGLGHVIKEKKSIIPFVTKTLKSGHDNAAAANTDKVLYRKINVQKTTVQKATVQTDSSERFYSIA